MSKPDEKFLKEQSIWQESQLTPAAQMAREFMSDPKKWGKGIASYWGNHYKDVDKQPYENQIMQSLPISPTWVPMAIGQMNNYAEAGDKAGMAVTAAGAVFSPLRSVGGITLKKGVPELLKNTRLSSRGVVASGADTGYGPSLLDKLRSMF